MYLAREIASMRHGELPMGVTQQTFVPLWIDAAESLEHSLQSCAKEFYLEIAQPFQIIVDQMN